MARVEVQQAPKIERKFGAKEKLAKVCFYYNYTLAEARRLPYKDVLALLEAIEYEQATNYLNLVHIVTAPHTEKGKGIKELVKHYKRIING